MRVVLVSPGFPTTLDDHHKPFLAEHARALAAAGVAVTVVCPAHPDAPSRHEVGGIEVHRLRFAPASVEARVARGESYRVLAGVSALWVIPMIVRLWLRAARLARRPSERSTEQDVSMDSDATQNLARDGVARREANARRVFSPDERAGTTAVIHGHWWFPCGLVAVAAAGVAGRRTSSVVHLHGSDAAVTTTVVRRWLARRVLRRAGAVVAVSEELRGWASSLMPRHRAARVSANAKSQERASWPLLRIVSMPVATERIGPATPTPAAGPVVAVGRLMAEKGFDVLIEAVALMEPNLRPDVVIVGDGPDRAALKAQSLQAGVNVHFVGAVPPASVADWYRRARLVCVPSRREGFGMVIAEAVAAGRPVVATAVGAAVQFVNHGVNGLLVAPGDSSALSRAINQALQPGSLKWDSLESGESGPLESIGPRAHADALTAIYADI